MTPLSPNHDFRRFSFCFPTHNNGNSLYGTKQFAELHNVYSRMFNHDPVFLLIYLLGVVFFDRSMRIGRSRIIRVNSVLS